MKYKKSLLGLLSLSAVAPATLAIGCTHAPEQGIGCTHALEQGASMPIFTENYNKFKEEGKTFTKYVSQEKDLLKVTQDADINLFFNSLGTITHTYMMRLAVLANTEVHYGLLHNAEHLVHQDKVNISEFTRFLQTRTVVDKPTDKKLYPNSDVFTVGNDVGGRAVTEKWLKIIKGNPTKKINIFWNSDHLDHLNGGIISTADLSAFPNVNLILLEDGAVVGKQIHPSATTHAEILATQSIDDLNKIYQIFLPEKFDNWKSYISSEEDVKRLNDLGMETYNYLNPEKLFEGIFNSRDVNGARLMAEWPKVSGLDWKDAKNILDTVSVNGKKSMIILGSYGTDEAPFLKELVDKYGGTYNLFYKGHPGLYQWNNFVKQNYNGVISLLDPMISSEELTKEHADQGMYFDKVACVGQTSAVIGGFHNGHNDITKDLLAAYISGKSVFFDDKSGTGNAEIAKAFGAYWKSIVAQK